MDQHELVKALKALALDLGHTPTRAEFESKTRGAHGVLSKLGGYSVLVQQAGLETYNDRRSGDKKEKPSELFKKCLETQLKEHEASSILRNELLPRNFRPILVVGDTHFPFVNKGTLEYIYEFIRLLSPDARKFLRVVQVGDLYDMLAHSRFPRSLNHYTPDQEMQLGREMAERFWRTIQAAAPEAECFQLLGNHDVRPLRQIIEKNPENESFVKSGLEKCFTFDGVKTTFDPRQELFLDGIMFHHGYRSKLGDHRDYALMNAVVGHTHTGGVTFRQIHGRVLWELNAGFCGDPLSKALSYTSQKISKSTQGFGWIDRYGPRFVSA